MAAHRCGLVPVTLALEARCCVDQHHRLRCFKTAVGAERCSRAVASSLLGIENVNPPTGGVFTAWRPALTAFSIPGMNPGRAQKLKGEPEPVIPKDDDAEEEEEEEEAPPPPEETEATPSGPKLEVDYAVGLDAHPNRQSPFCHSHASRLSTHPAAARTVLRCSQCRR
jgi:hypothetical protein